MKTKLIMLGVLLLAATLILGLSATGALAQMGPGGGGPGGGGFCSPWDWAWFKAGNWWYWEWFRWCWDPQTGWTQFWGSWGWA